MNYNVLGVLNLPYEVLCDESCLGKEFDIIINRIEGKFCLPYCLKTTEMKGMPILIYPLDNLSCQNTPKNGKTKWGEVIHNRKLLVAVSMVVLKFNNVSSSELEIIHSNITKWLNKFYKIKNIVTDGKYFRTYSEITFATPALYLYEIDNNFERIHNNGENEISSMLHLNQGGISFDECLQIINLTNNENNISFEYERYNSAIQSFYNNDYVKVIIDCSISLEKVLSSTIKKACKEKDVSFEKLSEKYKMLGGFFSLAEVLKISLPTSDYRENLNKLRNKVIHDGYLPTKQEADKYLKDIKKYLEAFSNILEK